MENAPPASSNALQQHYASVQEKDLLLRAAAEALYETQGNPYSNPTKDAGVINTAHWRAHEAVDFSHEAISTLVDTMVSHDYAPAHSPYAERRTLTPKLKILPEDKVLFHRLLNYNLKDDLIGHAQEIVLLKLYRDTLKAQPNDLSPALQAQLEETSTALSKRCDVLAQFLGPQVERCNIRDFPAPAARGRG